MPKPKPKTEASNLQETARQLLEVRNQPGDDFLRSPAARLFRRGSLSSQFEPQYISAEEALVAAWLYQRGDKRAAAELFFPRLDATSDDRLVRLAVRDMPDNQYRLAMLGAYVDARDYDRALLLARHLSSRFSTVIGIKTGRRNWPRSCPRAATISSRSACRRRRNGRRCKSSLAGPNRSTTWPSVCDCSKEFNSASPAG